MVEGLDIDLLMKSLEREENDCLMNLDTAKIQQIKNDMLQKLQLPREKLKKMNKDVHYLYLNQSYLISSPYRPATIYRNILTIYI